MGKASGNSGSESMGPKSGTFSQVIVGDRRLQPVSVIVVCLLFNLLDPAVNAEYALKTVHELLTVLAELVRAHQVELPFQA